MSNLSLDFAVDFRPLAARMRPERLDQYIGQSHLLAEGKPCDERLRPLSLHDFMGPPGTGKTTLAELMARYCQADVERISAVTPGVLKRSVRPLIERKIIVIAVVARCCLSMKCIPL